MSGAGGEVAAGAAENVQQQQQAERNNLYDLVSKVLLVFFGMQMLSRHFGPQQTSMSTTDIITPEKAKALTAEKFNKTSSQLEDMLGISKKTKELPVFPTHDEAGRPYRSTQDCVFGSDSIMDLSVYLSNKEDFDFEKDSRRLTWRVRDITYNWNYKETPSLELNITATPELKNNGSLYAHVFFVKQSYPLEKTNSRYDPLAVAYKRFPLVQYKLKKRPKVLRKLLDSTTSPSAGDSESSGVEDNSQKCAGGVGANTCKVDESESEKDNQPEKIVGYWQPSLHLSLVLDMPPFARNKIPPLMGKDMAFTDDGSYYPVIYHNVFWTMSKELKEINSSTEILPLSLSYAPIASWKWMMQNSMEEQWEMQKKTGLGTEKDADIMRETLMETSPWLLGLTAVVSMLHMLFDFLAFKNDIQFWRKKKSMEGMSLRSLAVNCFFQTVIFLYLKDNETSMLILVSNGIGLLIEYWKLAKAFNFTVKWGRDPEPDATTDSSNSGGSGSSSGSSGNGVSEKKAGGLLSMLPFTVKWGVSDSYSKNETMTHDQVATTHLLYALVPLMVGYSIYSLIHNPHKSFYSWFLGSLVGFVYVFGFIMMTPQLYINYKLKSVAHMPWKAMVYKALNTFIDDLFAFIIKMPILHRLACFRDDIIFFIYLYQRWVYRVDYTRVNEFGSGGEEPSEGQGQEQEKSSEGESKETTSGGGGVNGGGTTVAGKKQAAVSTGKKQSTTKPSPGTAPDMNQID